MSEIIISDVLKTAFWLLFFYLIIHKFHEEIKELIQSLSSLEVAGATFELKNKKETIRSYVLLSEALVELISRCQDVEALVPLINSSESEKLGSFAQKYINEVHPSEWNLQLLRNIAHLLIRNQREQKAIDICEKLLDQIKENQDFLNLKALALMTSRIKDNYKNAEDIFSKLVQRYPEIIYIRYNLALIYSLQEKFEDAEKEMMNVINMGFGKIKGNMLLDPLFHDFREKKQDSFEKLRCALDSKMTSTTN